MLYLDSLVFEPVSNIIKRNIGNRKLVLLGDSEPLRKLLAVNYDLTVTLIAVFIPENLDKGEDHRLLEEFDGKSDEYYICIPHYKYDKRVKERLEKYGYILYEDFAYANHHWIEVPPHTKDYEDEYGNVVKSSGNYKIIFTRYAGNSYVDISEDAVAGANSSASFFSNGAELRIEEKCIFGHDNSFELYAFSKIKIEKTCSFGYRLRMFASAGSYIDIGEDCMSSGEVDMYVADGHSIFNTETGMRTNGCYPHDSKNEIRLEGHVWVGLRCTILACKIGRSSIVGAGSLVRGEYPNNCVIGGNPASVRKLNVTWARDNTTLDIVRCGKDNNKLTNLAGNKYPGHKKEMDNMLQRMQMMEDKLAVIQNERAEQFEKTVQRYELLLEDLRRQNKENSDKIEWLINDKINRSAPS